MTVEFILDVAALASALLLMISGLEKLVATPARRWSHAQQRRPFGGRAQGAAELLAGLGAAGAISGLAPVVESQSRLTTQALAGYGLAALYLTFATGSAVRSIVRPGARCGCSRILEVPLTRPLSLVTLRAMTFSVSCAGYAAQRGPSAGTMTATELALTWLAALTLSIAAFILPYVHHAQSRLDLLSPRSFASSGAPA